MNGQFLSFLSQLLLEASEKNYSKSDLVKKVTAVIETYYSSENSSLVPNEDLKINDGSPINESLRTASAEDISRLSILLPWSAASQCSQFLIGGHYKDKKRKKVSLIPDPLVLELNEIIDLDNKNVIESGCFEGIHSVSMAYLGAKVYGFDVRIENVLKSIVRSWAYGKSNSTFFDLVNLENTSVFEFYRQAYPSLNVDLYHCRGVLYHLMKPIEYCHQISLLKPSFIYFHTQVADDDKADELINSKFGSYKFFNYKEEGRISPFAGVEKCAKWFTPTSLKLLMSKLGYNQVLFERLKQEKNGLRLQILFKKQ